MRRMRPARAAAARALWPMLRSNRLGIAHIDCDAFYASVEKRDRPELKDEPVIIGHTGGRGVVLTACYIARTFGARSAMPMFQALELCPQATVVNPDMAKYKRVSADIRTIFGAATSIIEPVSLDEAYLDLTDDYRTEAPPAAEALALIAARVEREVGITVSIGLSCNKFLAKLASELQKPRGFSVIGQAEAKSFLAPLSVRKIHGVGAVTARRMEESGLKTIADLQALPRAGARGTLRQVRPAAGPVRPRRGRPPRDAGSPHQEHLRRDHLSPGHGLGRNAARGGRRACATASRPSYRARVSPAAAWC